MTDKSEQLKRVSSGYAAKEAALPKTDIRYWRARVYKPVSVRKTAKVQGEHYAVKLQAEGKRMTLGLYTANREEASQHARRMYLDLMAVGWNLMLEKHRPKPATASSNKDLTFGEYIALVRSRNLLAAKAIDGYVPRLRSLVAQILEIHLTTMRRQAWVEQIESVPLRNVTPDMVRRWKKARLAKAGHHAINRNRAVTSVNSILRQARSLFSERKVIRYLPGIPRPHLFEDVELEPRVDTKFYGAGIDAPTLLRRALKDLAGDRKEELKAFLLAIALGLRRKEADLLEWDSFDFVRCTVTVRPTEFSSLKTVESAATLRLDPEIVALFKEWHAQSKSRWVIESDNLPRPKARYPYYRANQVITALVRWLREQGIKADKPFHVLRKMFGSLVVEKHGIFAASSALRHTSIELTNAYYADRTIKATSGLGSVLSDASPVEAS